MRKNRDLGFEKRANLGIDKIKLKENWMKFEGELEKESEKKGFCFVTGGKSFVNYWIYLVKEILEKIIGLSLTRTMGVKREEKLWTKEA